MSGASGSTLDIAVAVDDPAWREALPEAEALCRRAAAAVLAGAGAGAGEVSILLTDDRRAAALNERYRGVARATNVLSFAAGAAPGAPGAPVLLGDVVVARETVAREARAQGKTVADHLAHLVVHGTLHLLGYDHEDAAEARRMERLEAMILDRLGIADPYRAEEA